MFKTATSAPPKPKYLTAQNIRNKNRKRRRNKSKSENKTVFKKEHFYQQQSINSRSFQLWRKTYENIMSWQSEHQMNYWRNQAQTFRNVNEELWHKLKKYEDNIDRKLIPVEDSEYETSSSESDEDNRSTKQHSKNNLVDENASSDIDEEYLKFLEITQKHRHDLSIMRKLDSSQTSEGHDEEN